MTNKIIHPLKSIFNSNSIIWLIYAALLLALLPHTAWAFAKFEPMDGVSFLGIHWLAWVLAAVFELALGVFTHELAQYNSRLPDDASATDRYFNVYAIGLTVSWLLSTMANLAHSFEYAQPSVIAPDDTYTFIAYKVAFGAVLPLASALFARVLSNGQGVSKTVSRDTIRTVSNDTPVTQPKPKKRVKKTVSTGSTLERAKAELMKQPDLPMTRIAEIANVSVSTVNRAKKQLNGALEKSG